ncbi:MAG: hypothetical protein NT098_05015, partial [Candidatus Parcubacteria bacterium]|nr:hypothetical protein [Candidatus Parcubacteria bacterium]
AVSFGVEPVRQILLKYLVSCFHSHDATVTELWTIREVSVTVSMSCNEEAKKKTTFAIMNLFYKQIKIWTI